MEIKMTRFRKTALAALLALTAMTGGTAGTLLVSDPASAGFPLP
jgi:hypothetical protein